MWIVQRSHCLSDERIERHRGAECRRHGELTRQPLQRVADFSYTVTDGSLVSNTATVLVGGGTGEQCAGGGGRRARHDEDTPATYTAAQLLANDADIDSSTLTIASVTSGSNGTAVLMPTAR